jgi:prepilin signal peptidase PulO-like enzyme (type II secretory pathway)
MDVTIAGIIIGLFIGWRMDGLDLFSMMAGAAVAGGFFLAQYLLSRGKWIGAGDIFLGVMMGIWLGWPNTLAALLIAYVLGALGGLFLLVVRKRKLTSTTPFGTYLALGTFVALFWGQAIINWYANLFF